MEKKRFFTCFLFFGFLIIGIAQAENRIELNVQKVLEIGREDLVFASIVSIVEDEDTNFYVLDRMEHKVYKFSPEGKAVLSFGQKGQGPGDFQNPHLIAYSPEKQIIVADDLYNLSFLKRDGSFIKRIHLDGRLGVGYIGEDRFYAWNWEEQGRSQVLVDSRNDIVETFFQVPRESFSATAPDSSGRLVMFNYSRAEFTPALLFAHFGRYSAVGIGDTYGIHILDEMGKTIGRIRRDIKAKAFSKKEKKYFERDIEEYGKERSWPRSVIRDLLEKIPDKRIYFDQVLLTEKYVFVFRIRKNILEDAGLIPVDIFAIDGEFLGEAVIGETPLYISDEYMYFVRSDEDGNVFLEKATYQIDKK
jgi:hypothetical protein